MIQKARDNSKVLLVIFVFAVIAVIVTAFISAASTPVSVDSGSLTLANAQVEAVDSADANGGSYIQFNEPAPDPDPDPDPDPIAKELLLFNRKTSATDFHPSRADGVIMFQDFADELGFNLTVSEDAAIFGSAEADKFDAVAFVNTEGDVFNATQQEEFKAFILEGRDFIGVHGAGSTHWYPNKWDWYEDLLGAIMFDHPEDAKNPLTATLNPVDKTHGATKHLPDDWVFSGEFHNFYEVPTNVNVLLTIDESTYDSTGFRGGGHGDYHPMAWNHEPFTGVRSFFTALGHYQDIYYDDAYRNHVRGGVLWAMGLEETN